jgi:nicotinamide-nucleotide amidase
MPDRPLRTVALLSVGTELTTGGTRDTNAGDLARDLTAAGAWVVRMTALPDDRVAVRVSFERALEEADLVVSTGGLGPTPDDLTREAVADAMGETPAVDPDLERWLRGLWARRRLPFPEANLKQAWLIPSSKAIPNERGTAPGWWVDRPDGRVVVCLPGPPREMQPMWRDGVVPRLVERGLGVARAGHVLRTTGIGESQLAEVLGELLRATNPSVATYARVDGVDIRIAATDEPPGPDRSSRTAEAIAAATLEDVRGLVGDHVWGRDGDTWPGVIGAELARGGWRLTIVEVGTAGAVAALLGSAAGVVRTVSIGPEDPEARPFARPTRDPGALFTLAERTRTDVAGVTLAVTAAIRHDDTRLTIAVVGPDGRRHHERRTVFLRGDVARERLGAAAAAVLLAHLRAPGVS